MLEKKAIIVTGGGSGIGRATAQLLAQAGAKVLVADFNEESAKETVELIVKEGNIAKAFGADVTRESDVIAMVDEIVKEYGRIDGAFNNAGLPMQQKLIEDLEESDWDKVLNVNLKGVFFCMKHEIIAMRKSGGGAIVNTSSGNGLVGNPHAGDYCASKSGVLGLTRGAACEAAITGVRVNAICPGMIMTPMVKELVNDPNFQVHYEAALARHTIGRFGEPEEVGNLVKWLLSDEASFMNGAGIPIDGGYTAR